MNTKHEPILIIDGHHGIYIPSLFYEKCNPKISGWIWDYENSKELSNPDNENYWEVWEDILDSAYTIYKNKRYYLYQSDDLWAIPEGFNTENF
jgi:hypothetical protein